MNQSGCKGLMIILFGILCASAATGGGILFALSILGIFICFGIIDQLPKDD